MPKLVIQQIHPYIYIYARIMYAFNTKISVQTIQCTGRCLNRFEEEKEINWMSLNVFKRRMALAHLFLFFLYIYLHISSLVIC